MTPFSFNDNSEEYRAAVEQIKKVESCRPYLKKSRHGNFVCPFCGSGTGPNGSGALDYDEKTNTCFCYAGCADPGKKAKSYSAIDLYMNETGKEFADAVRDLAAKNNITLPEHAKKAPKQTAAAAADRKPTAAATAPEKPLFEGQEGQETPPRDFSEYFKICAERLRDPAAVAYLKSRGISIETARLLGLGFDPEADPANRPGAAPGEPRPHPAPRIITPFGRFGYVGRRTDGVQDYAKANAAGSIADISGAEFLEYGLPVFVVEGAFDALAIMEAEPIVRAISLNSTKNVENLLQRVKTAKRPAVILSLDNDDEGRKASEYLAEQLDALRVPHITADLAGEWKDPNAALVNGGINALRQKVRDAMEKAIATPAPGSGEAALDAFLEEIRGNSFEPIETGIRDIDRALYGGFMRQTLATLGAAPGLGKTALAQWIFENMAAAGKDVLYINLEMSRAQLLARSISRIAWKQAEKRNGKGISSLDVLRGYEWTPGREEKILAAAAEYRQRIAPHFVYNPDGTTNSRERILEIMKAETERLKAAGRPAPIVCIDYLQIIDTPEKDPTEGIKNTIFLLKDFAKTNDTTVFLITANNRASNRAGVADLESGRDTSAIEYSADLALGLTYSAIEEGRLYSWTEKDENGNTVRDKNGNPKQHAEPYTLETIRRLKREAYAEGREPDQVCNELTLKVLKNRFGETERAAKFIFDGAHATFHQIERETDDEEPRDTWRQGSFPQF